MSPGAPSGPRSTCSRSSSSACASGSSACGGLLTALGSPQRAFRAVHVVGHQRQELDRAHDRRAARGPRRAHRRLPLAAPRRRFAERIRIGDEDLDPAAFGGGGRARRGRGRAGRPHARRRRPRHPVRADHRRRASASSRAAGVEVGGRGGRPRRSPRRHQRARRARRRAHQRRPRAHALARPDAAPTSRARSSPSWRPRRDARDRRARSPKLEAEALATATRQGARLVRAAAPRAGVAGVRRCPATSATNFAVGVRGRGGAASARSTRRAVDRRRRARAGARPPAARGRAPADRARRRPQPERRGARSWPRCPTRSATRPVVAVISILDDKDAAGMLARAAAALRGRRASPARPNPRALPAATLASLAEQLGGPAAAGHSRSSPTRAARSSAPARSPARRAPSWPPARSTSSPTCSAGPAGGGELAVTRPERRDAGDSGARAC